LANERPAMKTAGKTQGIGQRNSAQASTVTKINDLVNEAMQKNGGDYDRAYASVKRNHKELFGLAN
jgi:hypothetical protein